MNGMTVFILVCFSGLPAISAESQMIQAPLGAEPTAEGTLILSNHSGSVLGIESVAGPMLRNGHGQNAQAFTVQLLDSDGNMSLALYEWVFDGSQDANNVEIRWTARDQDGQVVSGRLVVGFLPPEGASPENTDPDDVDFETGIFTFSFSEDAGGMYPELLGSFTTDLAGVDAVRAVFGFSQSVAIPWPFWDCNCAQFTVSCPDIWCRWRRACPVISTEPEICKWRFIIPWPFIGESGDVNE